ncbi:MAG: hypothetical protein K8T89_16410 [Planctomycetes bacterium]|nr:hypothetical protein [Planctomycetota bacterium]
MFRVSQLSVAALAITVLLTNVAPAKALRVAIPNRNPAQQAMTAEAVVVGKVTEIEKEVTKASLFPGAKDKVDYQVAVLKISESVLGAKGLTTIRVGTQVGALAPVQPNVPPNGQIRIRPAIAPFPQPQVSLTEGQEGCFFLTKHHDGDFYVLQQGGLPLDKKAADFDKQLDSVKKLLKAFEDPKTALQAKDAADRQFAACMLVQKYRQYPQITMPTPTTKVVQEPIDAEVSKLILKTLSEMDWANIDPSGANLQNTFYQLGLQPKDGWVQPKFVQGQDFNKMMGAAVKKWMTENADKYRIQRQVVSK